MTRQRKELQNHIRECDEQIRELLSMREELQEQLAATYGRTAREQETWARERAFQGLLGHTQRMSLI